VLHFLWNIYIKTRKNLNPSKRCLFYEKCIGNSSINNTVYIVFDSFFPYAANNDINRQAIAQQTTQKFPVPPETAEQFANLIEGNDTAIILNDTNISDVNDTLISSIGINIREDCMTLPNSTVLYCP
jgi:hypothetical protein